MPEWGAFGRMLRALAVSPGPSSAVSIGADHVSVVQLARGSGPPQIAGYARVGLPDGAVTPSITGRNIQDAQAVNGAVDDALRQLPRRPSRVALVMPDGAAKVSIVHFDEPPVRVADLDELIRWQVGSSAPFRLDEAQLAWTPGVRDDVGAQSFVTVLARRDVVQEYEAVCDAVTAHAGVADLACINLLNAALAHGAGADGGDWMLVQTMGGAGSIAIVRSDRLLFFRHMPADGGRVEDLVHQTVMYYQDRLGGRGLMRALIVGEAHVDTVVAERLPELPTERLVDRLAPLMDDRGAGGKAPLELLAAPIGILLRDRSRTVEMSAA